MSKLEETRMQIVIDIDDNLYTRLFDKGDEDEYVADMRRACVAIRKGTPIPKGHGDLKDAEKLKHAFITWSMAVQGNFTDADIASIICNSPTIIEADKESEDEEQIKVGTKVRTIKDKDFAGEEVFPVGTIGIVEETREDEKLPYIIRANLDFWYYSRDMFEVIED